MGVAVLEGGSRGVVWRQSWAGTRCEDGSERFPYPSLLEEEYKVYRGSTHLLSTAELAIFHHQFSKLFHDRIVSVFEMLRLCQPLRHIKFQSRIPLNRFICSCHDHVFHHRHRGIFRDGWGWLHVLLEKTCRGRVRASAFFGLVAEHLGCVFQSILVAFQNLL